MGYCHQCGVFQQLDDASKLCRPCWDGWPQRGTSRDQITTTGTAR